jgi:hypothetical protein
MTPGGKVARHDSFEPSECRMCSPIRKQMPEPTPEQLESPEFEAIWQVIKKWDVNVPEYYAGYCGATGSHVALILNALTSQAEGESES